MSDITMSSTDDMMPFVKLVCLDIHRLGLADSLISGYLVMQLVSLAQSPERGIDFLSVLDVIENIEKVPAEARRRVSTFRQQKELEGLSKAHFYDTAFMVKNLQQGLASHSDAKRKAIIEKYGISEGQSPSPEQISALTHELVSGTLEERAESEKRSTGEWIIMDQVDGRYRYLCLADHKLARKEIELLVEEVQKGRESMSEFKKMLSWSMK
ncbi:MAG: hypothetical protein CMH23_02510 [Methylophaga sp.]|uniref:hypothetical protein n=1 Tax=Methylophaga sp. TaxID=2024840 RepID=UPI000C8CEC72|nr:hypothetical protein [Methylophaga sp.]MBN45325.1 hypothetical protein [Methylophaga sp.]|tara:strand:- start:6092 stop:6727 length:636 start_codon:yes stop_codon:yes gene_type:complete